MPRPLKEDPRDVFKTFRFTHAEVTRLEGRARASGRNLSSYVRMVLLDRAGDEPAPEPMSKGPAPASSYQSAVAVLIEQIRKLGVNLNQIAHRMNDVIETARHFEPRARHSCRRCQAAIPSGTTVHSPSFSFNSGSLKKACHAISSRCGDTFRSQRT